MTILSIDGGIIIRSCFICGRNHCGDSENCNYCSERLKDFDSYLRECKCCPICSQPLTNTSGPKIRTIYLECEKCGCGVSIRSYEINSCLEFKVDESYYLVTFSKHQNIPYDVFKLKECYIYFDFKKDAHQAINNLHAFLQENIRNMSLLQ